VSLTGGRHWSVDVKPTERVSTVAVIVKPDQVKPQPTVKDTDEILHKSSQHKSSPADVKPPANHKPPGLSVSQSHTV